MATGPLALLGDVIASGTGDWAAMERERVERERARGERLADVAAERQFVTDRDKAQQDFQVQQQKTAREYEAQLYKERFLDSVKLDLMKKGRLKPADANSPEAFAKAIEMEGPDYLRAIQELQGYREAILRGEIRVPGVEVVLEMGPDRIAEVREIMASAAGTVADLADAERKTVERGRGVVAGMVSQSTAELAALSRERTALTSELARLNSGQFSSQEAEEIRQLTMAEAAKSGVTAKDFASPKNAEAVAAARQKAIQQLLLTKSYSIQQALQENTRRYSEASEALGVASRLSPAIAGSTPAGAATPAALSGGGDSTAGAQPQAPAAASASDAASFLGIDGGNKAQTYTDQDMAAMSAGAPKPTPVIRVPPAALGRDPVSAAAFSPPVNPVTGILNAGKAALGLFDSSLSGLNNLDAGIKADVAARALRQEEDRVLASEPYSERANQIRQKRGLPPLIRTTPPTSVIQIPPPPTHVIEVPAVLGGR